MTDFGALVARFLDQHFDLEPVVATAAGSHERDGLWPDLSDAGRSARLAFAERWTTELTALGPGGLGADERLDRDLLLGLLDDIRFSETRLREETWSPLRWVYLIGAGFFPLIAREHAPLARRLESVAARAEALPELLGQARAALVGHDGRPVDRLHTEKALDQWPGLLALLDDAVAAGEAAEPGDPDVAAGLPRLRAARATAAEALAALERHLRTFVLPDSAGDGRLGPELFAAKMTHTLRDPALTPDRVRERAEHEYGLVRAEMVRIAREIAPAWLTGAPVLDDDEAVVRAVLDAIAAEHPPRDERLEFCRAELARIEDFCRDRELVGLADDPLEIRWTPPFLRAYAGAMLSSPGPLDTGLQAIFSITPIPEDATDEEAESHLREDNDRMLRLLTIHEAVPGHYLQGVYANRCPSIVRAIYWDGVYAEGWAVYVTQIMMDAGYAADDPALLLTHWKYYLRAVINARIDVGVHTAGMTEDEAVTLMVEGGFQEKAQARAKFDRARLSSTQLSTYFVGSLAFWDLDREARRRAAATSGDPRGADAVPEPRVVGGYSETPGFDRRAHLEACLSHGALPMPLLRRAILGEDGAA